jgi:hypothetical protein
MLSTERPSDQMCAFGGPADQVWPAQLPPGFSIKKNLDFSLSYSPAVADCTTLARRGINIVSKVLVSLGKHARLIYAC